jgi:eukaryotic-like serine/threonine-protein kinase
LEPGRTFRSRSDGERWQLDDDLTSKYEIFDVLGGGGMGRVVRARHRQLKRWVAIKLLSQDLKASDAVSRFIREARAAAQIRSSYVAHVLDAGLLKSGQPYIVMELLQGRDLSRVLASQQRLSTETAVGFVLQALEAIAEAHSLDIIHRDIKPGNLFVSNLPGGETAIKVVDFGLAKTNQGLDTLDPSVTERGAVLGTPSYMSPEQFVNAQDVDARADVWGIGATLFELLTGEPPFTGTNLPQIYTAVMHLPIPLLRSSAPELPVGLEQVIATCLMRDREQRYANVAELAAALEPHAAASARVHVERIRRILETAHEGADNSNAGGDATDTLQPDSIFSAPGARGVISSTFERDADEPRDRLRRAARSSPRPMLVSLGIGLVAALAGATIAWTLSAGPPYREIGPAAAEASHQVSRAEPNVATSEQPSPPSAATSGEAASAVPAQIDAQHSDTAVSPATPAALAAPSRPKRSTSKVSKPGARTKHTSSSIYERYP